MLVFVAVAVGIITLNAVFQFEGLQVATNASYVTAFGAAGSNALVLLLLDIQHYGTLSAQVFFGLWLAPLGYLAYKSGLFPKALGVTLVAATVCYLVDLFAAFLVPELRQADPLVHCHRAHHRGDLDGPIPARGWRENREARQGHPCRGVNAAERSILTPYIMSESKTPPFGGVFAAGGKGRVPLAGI